MTKPDPNSPEALLATTRAELATAKAELAKNDTATLRAELATANADKTRLQAALAAANAKLAAKGEAPSLTTAERIRARANENAAKSVTTATGAVLTSAQKSELYAQMDKLPASEQRAFYENNIRGRVGL